MIDPEDPSGKYYTEVASALQVSSGSSDEHKRDDVRRVGRA